MKINSCKICWDNYLDLIETADDIEKADSVSVGDNGGYDEESGFVFQVDAAFINIPEELKSSFGTSAVTAKIVDDSEEIELFDEDLTASEVVVWEVENINLTEEEFLQTLEDRSVEYPLVSFIVIANADDGVSRRYSIHNAHVDEMF